MRISLWPIIRPLAPQIYRNNDALLDNAPFDLAEIKLAFESGSIIKQFKAETEISIQNNSSVVIKRLELRIDVYDKQWRKLLDTLYVDSDGTFKPNKTGRGHLYLSDFRAPGDRFLLFLITRVDMNNGSVWDNVQKDCIAKDMQKAVEDGELR